MPRDSTPLVERTLTQVDRAFWCVHDHLEVMVRLGWPIFGALAAVAFTLTVVWRTWDLPGWVEFLFLAVVVPWIALILFTALALPCTVFARLRAGGEVPTAAECFAYCGERRRRWVPVLIRLALLWFGSLLLFGIPLMIVWPRTCLTPLVALFEDVPNIFRRSRRILKDNTAVYVIGGIYLGIGLVLGGLVFLPRLVLGTQMLGAHVMDDEWRQFVLQWLWVFEALSSATILTALSMGWWISLTLLYHDIRVGREGEDLRRKLVALRGKVLAS